MQQPNDPDHMTQGVEATELSDVERRLASVTEPGRYHLTARIGAGGMGVVYKAIDQQLNRAVAVKAIRSTTRLEESGARLRKEARSAASLDHPYICRVVQLIQTQDEQFILMEFVDGETLASMLRRGVPPLETTVQLGLEIAEGLANAHDRGLVHRDLKPANIMVTPHGHIKLLDFGLAHLDPTSQPTGESQSSLLSQDPHAGTPYCMAPEQAERRTVTRFADIFSLGVILFECVAGRLPFASATPYEYIEHLRSDKPLPVHPLAPTVPDELARLIDACLQRTPGNRPESAHAIVRELRRIAGSSSSGAATAGARGRRVPMLVSLALVAGSLIAAVVALWWWRPTAAPETAWRSRPFVTASREVSRSRISPDKQWISYLSTAGDKIELLVQRIDSGSAQQVSTAPGTPLDQMWTADGKRLIVALRQGSKVVLRVLPAFFGGTLIRTLTLSTAPTDVQLLREVGATVFIETSSGGEGLARADFDSGSVTDISGAWPAKGRFLSFAVSPDGRRVAYTLFANGREDLWTANIDGSSTRRLTDDASFDRYPLWSADGASIFFQSNRGGQIDLWEIASDSGAARQLTSGRDAETPESVSSDGSLMTFGQTSDESHLWMWDPSTRTTKRLTDDALSDFSPVATSSGSRVVFERAPPMPIVGTRKDSNLFVGSLKNAARSGLRLPVRN